MFPIEIQKERAGLRTVKCLSFAQLVGSEARGVVPRDLGKEVVLTLMAELKRELTNIEGRASERRVGGYRKLHAVSKGRKQRLQIRLHSHGLQEVLGSGDRVRVGVLDHLLGLGDRW